MDLAIYRVENEICQLLLTTRNQYFVQKKNADLESILCSQSENHLRFTAGVALPGVIHPAYLDGDE